MRRNGWNGLAAAQLDKSDNGSECEHDVEPSKLQASRFHSRLIRSVVSENEEGSRILANRPALHPLFRPKFLDAGLEMKGGVRRKAGSAHFPCAVLKFNYDR
jgi:hypothetical protein